MTEAIRHHGRTWWMRPPVWVLVTFAVLSVAFSIGQFGRRPPAISYGAFLAYVDAGEVASVVFRGTEIDGRFKHSQEIAFREGTSSSDVFRSRMPDFDDGALIMELRGQHVAIDVRSSSQWLGTDATVLAVLGAFFLAKPMLLVLAVGFIAGLVRVARGGKTQMQSALAVHPMQAMMTSASGGYLTAISPTLFDSLMAVNEGNRRSKHGA